MKNEVKSGLFWVLGIIQAMRGLITLSLYIIPSAMMWYLPAYWGNEGGDQVSAARAVILVASQVHSAVVPAVNQNYFHFP